jgi:hypothetical protein
LSDFRERPTDGAEFGALTRPMGTAIMFLKRLFVRPAPCAGPTSSMADFRCAPARPPRAPVRPALLAALHLCLGTAFLSGMVGESFATASEGPARTGIRVQPPMMCAPDIKPGREVALPAPITVENRGSEKIFCDIEPIAPSSLGMRSMPGYADLPDPSWCKPEQGTVTLAPGEAKSIAVRLLVPDEPCNYNRHWCVAFSIQSTGEGTLGIAAYPYAYLETASSKETIRPPEPAGETRAQPPATPRGTGSGFAARLPAADDADGGQGCAIITPGILDAGDVPVGSSSEAGFVCILNTKDEDISFEVAPVVPDPGRSARTALLTPGHTWIRSTDWLRPAVNGFSVCAGEQMSLGVTVAGPADSTLINYRWEGFLAINGSDGSHSLVRVRWRTTEGPDGPDLMTRRPSPRGSQ